jgi:transcriptional regulator with GAF, ATPase, and Fis domain
MPTDELTDQSALDMEKLEEFQGYIFDLSATFIAMPAPQVAAEIDKCLGEIGRFWDFGQIFLTRLTAGGTKLITIHAYHAPGARSAPPEVDTAQVPWLMNIIQRGRPKAMYRVEDELPDDAVLDRERIEKLGVKSALILPFIVGGEVEGGLFFNSIRQYRDYSPELVKELQRLGQILAGTLERLKAFTHIQHTMRFDRLLSEISATYINLPSREILQHLQQDLGRIGAFLEVDRCIFYLPDEKRGSFRIEDRLNWWMEPDRAKLKKLKAWINTSPEFHDDFQQCFDQWNRGEVVCFSTLDELPPEAEGLRRVHLRLGNRSWLSVPVSVGGAIVGALVVATIQKERTWPEELIPRLRLFGEIFANAIKRREHEGSLRKALTEIKRLKQQVEADYVYLRDELTLEHHFEEIIGHRQGLKAVLLKVEQVAPTDASVLILGETGTGKELIARAIHNAGSRSGRPLVKVNCAALTPNLIESELFGHEKGAFTGAEKQRVGRFELANGATLFLDEIGELPLELQPKLLRVLQEGEFERLGGSRTLRVDVRIIAATNRNLEKEVEKARFRSDLWYRLNSFPISIPPLRERLEDIPLFVNHFVNQYCTKIGKRFDKVPKKALQRLTRYSWPGNIRELENIISRAVITSEPGNLQVQVPESPQSSASTHKTFKEMEKLFILETLEDTGWKIEGKRGAAKSLGLKPSTLRNRMKRLDIRRPASPF